MLVTATTKSVTDINVASLSLIANRSAYKLDKYLPLTVRSDVWVIGIASSKTDLSSTPRLNAVKFLVFNQRQFVPP